LGWVDFCTRGRPVRYLGGCTAVRISYVQKYRQRHASVLRRLGMDGHLSSFSFLCLLSLCSSSGIIVLVIRVQSFPSSWLRGIRSATTQTGWIVWRRKIIQDYVCEITVLFILNIRDVSIYISCSTAKSAPVASMLIL